MTSYQVPDRRVGRVKRSVRPRENPHIHRQKIYSSEGCTEPHVTGPIIVDTSLESYLSLTSGGPTGDGVPMIDEFYTPGPPLTWYDKSSAEEPFAPQLISSGNGITASTTDRLHVSSANPRTGTYHARWGSNAAFTDLTFKNGRVCVLGDPQSSDLTGTWAGFYSARVEPGDIVTWGAWFDAASSMTMRLFMDFYDSGQIWVSFESSDRTIGTTYAYEEYIIAAPANAHYVVVGGESRNFVTVDADDFGLTIT